MLKNKSRMVKKPVQQGRSKRRGEAYFGLYVEPLSDARTQLAGFFTILLVVGGAFRPTLEKALIRHTLGFNRKGPGFQGQPLFSRATGAIRQDIP